MSTGSVGPTSTATEPPVPAPDPDLAPESPPAPTDTAIPTGEAESEPTITPAGPRPELITPRHATRTRRDSNEAGRNRARPRRNWGWLVALIVLALLAGGGFGYYYWTNANARDNWKTYLTASDTIGVLKIPSLGADFAVPIRPGTSAAMLQQGVGWYPGTTMLGQRRNFAGAVSRRGYGQQFYRLADLKPGDIIISVTADQTYTYTVVTGPITVSRDDTDILSAVPGGPGLAPTRALITLTTAQALLPTRDRTVVIGQLTG